MRQGRSGHDSHAKASQAVQRVAMGSPCQMLRCIWGCMLRLRQVYWIPERNTAQIGRLDLVLGQLGAHVEDPDRSAQRPAIPCISRCNIQYMVVASMMTACCMLVKSCEYEMTRLITAGCRWVMMVAHELTTIVHSTHTPAWTYITSAFQGPMKEKLWSCCWPGQQRAVERFIRNLSEEMIPVLCRDVYKRFFEQAPSGQNYFKQSTTRLYFIASKAGDLPHMSKRSLGIQLRAVAINCSLVNFQQEVLNTATMEIVLVQFAPAELNLIRFAHSGDLWRDNVIHWYLRVASSCSLTGDSFYMLLPDHAIGKGHGDVHGDLPETTGVDGGHFSSGSSTCWLWRSNWAFHAFRRGLWGQEVTPGQVTKVVKWVKWCEISNPMTSEILCVLERRGASQFMPWILIALENYDPFSSMQYW